MDVTLLTNPVVELALVGLLILHPEDRWRAHVTTADFTDREARDVFVAITALQERSESVDLASVSTELQRHNPERVGIAARLCELAEQAGASVETLGPILRECSVRRNLVTAGQELVRIGRAEPYQPLEMALACVTQMQGATTSSRPTLTLQAAVAQRVEQLQQPGDAEAERTGFAAIDNVLGGMPRGELTVLAARTSMGKSALAQQIAYNVAKRGGRVLLATPEMAAPQIADRILAQQAEIPLQVLRRRQMANPDWTRIAEVYAALPPMALYDAGAQTTGDIAAEARKLGWTGPLALVVVDHLQYLADLPLKGENRTALVGRMVRALKQLARALDCAVLVLSQLNRQSEQRTDKRPSLADLRESGDIEQDADVVLLLHRPGYYCDSLPEQEQRLCELHIAKARNGPTGKRELIFEEEFARFVDVERGRRVEAA